MVGFLDKELNEENCELIGKGFGTFLKRHSVKETVMGFDAREYSECLKNALVLGLVFESKTEKGLKNN